VNPRRPVHAALVACTGRRLRAIIGAMNADPAAARLVPARPSLDGLEETWSSAWDKERVVQV
jgi:hypothetical protein